MPRATGYICVTKAGPAATERWKSVRGRKGGNESWEVQEEGLRKVIATEVSEGGRLVRNKTELLAGAVVREAAKGS